MAKSKPKRPKAPPRFDPGAKVRVKHGVRDPDFPDVPLGGWAGSVKEVHQAKGEVTYLIAWDRRTLANLHPVYRKRCERDGLEFETMWLGEGDIEPDEGKPMPIERPTTIEPRPLSEKEQEDRVRMALGLSHDDPLPDVNHETLLAYHRYLAAHLGFPFQARYEKRIGWSERVEMPLTVTGLLRPEDCEIDEQYGVIATGRDAEEPVDFPLAEVEVRGSSPSGRMVRDYAYWFHNWR
jgi:hypothetical protein